MKITSIGIGTRGDVQPLVELGVEMKRRGHDYRVASFECFLQSSRNGILCILTNVMLDVNFMGFECKFECTQQITRFPPRFQGLCGESNFSSPVSRSGPRKADVPRTSCAVSRSIAIRVSPLRSAQNRGPPDLVRRLALLLIRQKCCRQLSTTYILLVIKRF